jgi:phage-related holin
MADRKSLGMLGFMFGGVTAAVMLIAVMVVKNHIDGRLTPDAVKVPVMASAVQSIIR